MILWSKVCITNVTFELFLSFMNSQPSGQALYLCSVQVRTAVKFKGLFTDLHHSCIIIKALKILNRLLTDRLLTDLLLPDRLLTAWLLTDRLLTDRLLTDRLLTARLLVHWLLTARLLTDWLLTARLLVHWLLSGRLLTERLLTVRQFTGQPLVPVLYVSNRSSNLTQILDYLC